MFCYIVDTIIWQIGHFAACRSACLSDVDSAFVYFCLVYPIYILNRLNLLQTDGKTYSLDIPF